MRVRGAAGRARGAAGRMVAPSAKQRDLVFF